MNENQPESGNTLLDYEHDKWKFEQNLAAAHHAHDAEIGHHARLLEATINNGNLFLRALLIIHGGASIAIFTLIGSLASSDAPIILIIISTLSKSLVWFAWGVVLTAISMGLMYIATGLYASASVERKHEFDYPYIRETEKSEEIKNKGYRLHGYAALAATVSVILLIVGIVRFMFGVGDLNEIMQ